MVISKNVSAYHRTSVNFRESEKKNTNYWTETKTNPNVKIYQYKLLTYKRKIIQAIFQLIFQGNDIFIIQSKFHFSKWES